MIYYYVSLICSRHKAIMSLLFGPSKRRLHVHYTMNKNVCLNFLTKCTFHPTNCIKCDISSYHSKYHLHAIIQSNPYQLYVYHVLYMFLRFLKQMFWRSIYVIAYVFPDEMHHKCNEMPKSKLKLTYCIHKVYMW